MEKPKHWKWKRVYWSNVIQEKEKCSLGFVTPCQSYQSHERWCVSTTCFMRMNKLELSHIWLCQSKHLSSLRRCLGKTFSQWKVKVRQMKYTLASAKENIQRWLNHSKEHLRFYFTNLRFTAVSSFFFFFSPFPLVPLCLSGLAAYISSNNTRTRSSDENGWCRTEWIKVNHSVLGFSCTGGRFRDTHTYAKPLRSDSLSDIRIRPYNLIPGYRLTNQIMTHHSYSISPNLQSFSLASQTSV